MVLLVFIRWIMTDLSGGQRYPSFEQLRPGAQLLPCYDDIILAQSARLKKALFVNCFVEMGFSKFTRYEARSIMVQLWFTDEIMITMGSKGQPRL